MAELLIGVFAWAAAAGMGMRLLRVFGVRLSASEQWTFGSALGLGVLAYAVFALGSFGFLSRPFWVAAIAAVFAVCFPELERAWRQSRQASEAWPRVLQVCAGLAAVALAASLLGALAPATGQDELCYHLAQPAHYWREGRVYAVPYSTNALWPYLTEMLFTLGLVLRDDSVSKFFHWAMTLTAAGAVYAWTRRFEGSRQAALWAAILYAAAPAVFIQASFAYVDSALAAYTLLAVLALVQGLRDKSLRWTVLGGTFAGLAASTKLLGLIAVLLGASAVLASLRTHGRRAWAHAAAFGLCAALAGGIWYGRAWVLRGNPVFPFYPQVFGAGWHDPTYVNAHGRAGLAGFLTFPWDLTMAPVWFGGEAPGPLFLMLVPAAFLAGRATLPARLGAVFGLLYSALWFVVDPNVRFFFPALAFFAAPAGYAAAECTAGPSAAARAARVLIVPVFAASAALGLYHFHDEAASVVRGDRDAYLRRHERSFGAAQAVNAALGPADRILSAGEVRGYYFNLRHPLVLEGDFANMTRNANPGTAPADVVRFWRERGMTHVLAADGGTPSADPRTASALLADPRARQEWLREKLVVQSGGVRYVLYEIL